MLAVQDVLETSQVAAAQRMTIESDPRITTMAAAIRAAGERPANHAVGGAFTLLDARGTEQRLTYPALWTAARATAAGLRARGVGQGDRVLLLLPTSEAYLITLCAAILLGAVPCTVAASTTRGKTDDMLRYLTRIYQKLNPLLLVVPPDMRAPLLEHPVIAARRVTTVDDLAHHSPLAVEALPAIDPAQPLHIQLTSGTTNNPKGVVLSHHNVIANVRAISQAVDYAPETDSTLLWLPLYHDMGLIQLLTTIYYQSTIMLMTPTAFLRNPLSWLHNIATHGITLSAAPTFAYGLCVRKYDPARLEGVDLRSWRRAFVGAEPVPLNILEDFIRCYGPYGLSKDALYPCYGMAETVLATSLPLDKKQRTGQRFTFVSCDRIDREALRADGRAIPSTADTAASPALDVLGMGYAVQGLELCIRGVEGQVVVDRTVGEICVRGTSLMQGYFEDAEATAAALNGGWYHTGDRGYLVDGELFVLGRIKELIIVRGRNYQPHDLEMLIEEHEATRKGYCVVFGIYNAEQGTDDVIALIETRAPAEKQPLIAQQIQQSLQRVFGFFAHDIVFVHHGTLPRTTSGKRQRVLSQEWYRAGMFGSGSAGDRKGRSWSDS